MKRQLLESARSGIQQEHWFHFFGRDPLVPGICLIWNTHTHIYRNVGSFKNQDAKSGKTMLCGGFSFKSTCFHGEWLDHWMTRLFWRQAGSWLMTAFAIPAAIFGVWEIWGFLTLKWPQGHGKIVCYMNIGTEMVCSHGSPPFEVTKQGSWSRKARTKNRFRTPRRGMQGRKIQIGVGLGKKTDVRQLNMGDMQSCDIITMSRWFFPS